jgi:hypothetical protein
VTRSRQFAALTAIALAVAMAPAVVEAVVVDCARNQKITPRIKEKAVITLKGACTENLTIEANDVVIRADASVPTSLSPADPTQPTVRLDGALRVEIGGAANPLTVNGGTFGVAATRGSTLTLSNCVVSGATNAAVVSSYGSTVSVDTCQIVGNNGNGIVAANTSSAIVTNTDGTLVVKPVTVSGNGGNGIIITESASANVVGGVVEDNATTNIFAGRGSSAQIGIGSNNLTAGVAVQNGHADGIVIEGGNATIVHSTISNNARTGILVSNAGSARIGILNGNAGYGPTTVSGNGASGIHVAIGASAFIGGTTVDGNGTAPPGTLGRYGIGIHQATATLAGGNLIQNNAATGVFVRAGQVYIGDAAFGLATDNTITNNGNAGPDTGGLFAFQNGVVFVNDAAVSNNAGAAVQAFEGGVIELRAATSVVARTGVPGATLNFSSILRVRDTASVSSDGGDGAQASNMSAINVRDATTVIQGNGAGNFGVRCTNTGPLAVSAATLTGNLTGVTGPAGSHQGCTVFP